MPVNQYFNNYPKKYTQEQALVEDLLTEAIKIYGADVIYIVRESAIGSEQDLVYGEDPTSKFSKNYKLEMYLNNVDGHAEGGELLAKFGLQINEGATFILSRRTFKKWVPESVAIRPREGDLIYFPVTTNLYEIKFVEHETNYYTLGRDSKLPYIYELRCEMFRFSNEEISTGIPEIDEIAGEEGYVLEMQLNTGTGDFDVGEFVYQGTTYGSAVATAVVKGWNPASHIITVNDVKGVFSNTGNISGVTTGATWSITDYDTLADTNSDFFDNRNVQDETDEILDISEINPFGNP